MDGARQVDKLLEALEADLKDTSTDAKLHQKRLEELKILGREPRNAAPIFSKRGLGVLQKCAFQSRISVGACSEAMRCIANALFLSTDARDVAVDLGMDFDAAEHYKNASLDDEFLVARILFWLTYGTKANFAELCDLRGLHHSIIAAMRRHAAAAEAGALVATQLLALAETLKFTFNLAHLYQNLAGKLAPLVPEAVRLLLKLDVKQAAPLDPPMNFLINVFMPFALESTHTDDLFPEGRPDCVIKKVLEVLDLAVQTVGPTEMEEEGAVVVTLLRRLYEMAPAAVKTVVQQRVLPSEKQRELPLGRSQDLPGRLLRLSTSPSTPQLREAISSLLFETSDKDARKFVGNVGYGYASGFLVNHRIPHDMPQTAEPAAGEAGPSPTQAQSSTPAAQPEVDFVTGQFLKNQEKKDTGPPMTEEEKLREAERLFVLFERLKQTGVVNVQNPVEAAMQSGKIEELPD